MSKINISKQLSLKIDYLISDMRDGKQIQIYNDNMDYWEDVVGCDESKIDIIKYNYRTLEKGEIILELVPEVWVT